jgi:hypothetical protein
VAKYDLSLRELYRALETPGASPLKDVQNALDQAVREAYGMWPAMVLTQAKASSIRLRARWLAQ